MFVPELQHKRPWQEDHKWTTLSNVFFQQRKIKESKKKKRNKKKKSDVLKLLKAASLLQLTQHDKRAYKGFKANAETKQPTLIGLGHCFQLTRIKSIPFRLTKKSSVLYLSSILNQR